MCLSNVRDFQVFLWELKLIILRYSFSPFQMKSWYFCRERGSCEQSHRSLPKQLHIRLLLKLVNSSFQPWRNISNSGSSKLFKPQSEAPGMFYSGTVPCPWRNSQRCAGGSNTGCWRPWRNSSELMLRSIFSLWQSPDYSVHLTLVGHTLFAAKNIENS